MLEVTYYIKVFIAIFVLVNPIEGIPLFLSKTHNLTKEEKIAIAKKTSIAVFVILIISLFFGKYVLELLGISLPSFSLAGGIIIFLISIQMVIGKSDSADKSIPGDSSQTDDIAIVPLATPLLAGPGAISSVIVYGSRSPGLIDDIFLCAVVVIVAVVVWLALKAATTMEKTLNQTGIKVMTKISGLLVSAIAIELIFTALIKLIAPVIK